MTSNTITTSFDTTNPLDQPSIPDVTIDVSLYASAPVMDTKITADIGFAVYKCFPNMLYSETDQDCDPDGYIKYTTSVFLDESGVAEASLFELSQELDKIREKYSDQIHYLTDSVPSLIIPDRDE